MLTSCHWVYSSAEDEAGARAHGAGGAHGARVEHYAPHLRPRAVGATPLGAAGTYIISLLL